MQLEKSLTHTAWDAIGISPHNGVNTPLFSLKTRNSSGIGEFLDLIPLIDWVHSLGFNMIQLLPIYDTGDDPSPYNALSANALNPIYISLYALPGIQTDPLKELNQKERFDYDHILKTKITLLKEHFSKFKTSFEKEEQETFLNRFPWAKDYAAFKAKNNLEATSFYIWLQAIAYAQMHSVKAYAESKKVFIKGDIPILVSPESVDVQTHRDIFDLSLVAGAPPDYYNSEGQRWGFPIYKFDPQLADGFAFWKERLKSAQEIFHLYRLDHIVGLFRIWGIPQGKKPVEGHFVPQDRHKWRYQGETLLKVLIESSAMLPVGEDLGIIPHETREAMAEFGIPGTKVMRWERDWKGDHHFIPYSHYPIVSMTTVSTHDSDPLLLWWKNHPDDAKAFANFKGWNYTPTLSREHHIEILRDSHTTPSLLHINLLQEYLSLFPELIYPDESLWRINTPGTISDRNWSIRYRPCIEDLQAHQGLTALMRGLIL